MISALYVLTLLCRTECIQQEQRNFCELRYKTHVAYLHNDSAQEKKAQRHFIYPNEWASHSFQQFWATTQAKMLISVGTFLPILDFTKGPFDLLILQDIDKLAYEFNLNHLSLIKGIFD